MQHYWITSLKRAILVSHPLFIKLSCSTLLSHVSSPAGKPEKSRHQHQRKVKMVFPKQLNKIEKQKLKRRTQTGCLDRATLLLIKCCKCHIKVSLWSKNIQKDSIVIEFEQLYVTSSVRRDLIITCFSYWWSGQAPWQSRLCHMKRSSCCCHPLQMSPWGENQWPPGWGRPELWHANAEPQQETAAETFKQK